MKKLNRVVATGFASVALISTAHAATVEPEKLTGLWLTTDFPVVTHAVGDDISLDLVMENRNLPPQKVKLDVTGLPSQWQWEFSGEGQSVGAATVRPDQTVELALRVTPPADAKPGSYEFKVSGINGVQQFELPVTVNLTAEAAPRISLEPKLPALRGTPRSNFEFELTVKNESKDDQVFNLLAETPNGFTATFKEQFGSNELSSVPVKAGETKTVKLAVTPPRIINAGQYPVRAAVASPATNAQLDLLVDITGQANLAFDPSEGRLSGDATAGQERSFSYQVSNTGTADATDVKFASTPPSGWKVKFAPEALPLLKAGEKADIQVTVTPAEKAITGDYMVTLRAEGSGLADSSDFRVTVKTSTAWGIAGLGIIGASLLAFGASIARFGRR